MLALLLATWLVSKMVVALDQQIGQATGTLSQPVLPSYLPVPNYNPNLDSNQAPQESPDNCPNLETLQNILNLLLKLSDEESNSQYQQPDRKLRVLRYLKKQFEKSGPENNKVNQLDMKEPSQFSNKAVTFNKTNTRALRETINNNYPDNSNPKNQIEAQFSVKYSFPYSSNTGCKEVLTTLIQTINAAHSQLLSYCIQSGKCNIAEAKANSNLQLQDLLGTLKDILNSSQPEPSQPQFPAKFPGFVPNSLPEVSDVPNPINRPYNPESQNKLYNEYLIRSLKNYYSELHKTKQENVNHNSDEREANMYFWQNLFNSHYNPNGFDIDKKNNFDDLIKLYQTLIGNKNYLPKPPQIVNNEPQNLNPNIVDIVNPLLNTVPSENDYINQLKYPNLNIQDQGIQSATTNLQDNFISNYLQAIQNQIRLNPNIRLNPYIQNYLAYYHNQGIYDSKLLDSPHLDVTNLLKLNSAGANNAVVELTYKLKHPQSLLNKPYYYVKYKMPYHAFMTKVQDLMSNPQLRRNPNMLHEELISVSNLADLSPDLKDFKREDLIKLINYGGMLISAKVINANSQSDDQYIKVLQNLNVKLNTNDIVNFAANQNKINTESDTIRSDLLNSKLLIENLPYQDGSELLTPIKNRHARNNVVNPLLFVTEPPNAVKPRIMYNTLLNANSFSPFPFEMTSPKPLFG